MEKNYISVTQFNTIIKNIFSAEEMLHNIAIFGEVSGFKISGKHAYFNLKDKGGVLACSCFFYSKTYIPKEGESVILKGSPDYYVKGGRFSFKVDKIEAVGVGALYKQIEELKIRLTAEGVFDESHKKPIPKFSKNIVVITSKTGAVIRDIATTVRKKNPVINIIIYDVKVQGEFASKEIVDALNNVDNFNYDCVILARGGGSLEDLMPFNDEQVVRAMFNLKTPIISAIGHETDFTLCDFVADFRAATPTAAGDMVAYDYYKAMYDIFEMQKRIRQDALNILDNNMHKTKYLVASIGSGMERLYKNNLARLKVSDMRLVNSMQALQVKREHSVDKFITSLDKLNPTRILKSGYFRVYKENLPIMSIKNIKVGEKINVLGADGRLLANVIEIMEDEL